MFGKSAKTGRLIVSGIACAVDPTMITFAATSLDATIHASDEWLDKHPGLDKLAGELETAFAKEIAQKRYDKPNGVRVLLPQMLEASFPKDATFAALSLEPGLILTHMKQQLTEPEHRKRENLDAFDAAFLPILTTACNDARLIAAIQPALIRQQGRDSRDLKAMMQQVLEGQSASIALEDMIALAAEFGEHNVTDRPSLEKFLNSKAEEHRALKAEVDAIPDDMKRLANLKAAAQDAIARVDLDEVEHLLSIVQTTELEEAAKTAELRANNALLKGDVEKAFLLLSTAADSFAAVDPLEPVKRRLRYEDVLYENGYRYGGAGIALSERMIREALGQIPQTSEPALWASAQNSLAIALKEQGSRTEGSEGAGLLNEAVSACRAVLEVISRDAHPAHWAMTQNNLAIVLKEQSRRTGSPEDVGLLAEAVAAYRAALDVNTRDAHPLRWAAMQQNLAIALKEQGTRTDGNKGATLLAEAVSANRTALAVRTRDAHPVHWAMTQNNLGSALKEQGIRTEGPKGAKLLAEAISTYRAALEVRTRDAHPVHWAMTQENIASAERARAAQDSCVDPAAGLQRALDAVEAALTVYSPIQMSLYHAEATRLRDGILADIDPLSNT